MQECLSERLAAARAWLGWLLLRPEARRLQAVADHHLRQSLHALGLYATVLEERLTDANALRVLHGLQLSLRIVQQHLELLLDLSNIEAGLRKPRLAPLRLMPLLAHVVEDERALAARRGVELRIVPTSVSVRSEPALLRRMLAHLLTCAIRCAERGRITLGCRRAGHCLRLQVAAAPFSLREDAFEFSVVHSVGGLLGHTVAVHPAAGRGALFAIEVERA